MPDHPHADFEACDARLQAALARNVELRARVAELEKELADLYEGRTAVLPKTREHAEKLWTVADACLNGNGIVQPFPKD